MADEEDIDVSKPKEPPKAVHIGGESLADRILPHLKKIIVTIIVVAVILSVVFGIRAWKHSKQSDQTEKFAKVMQLAQRPIAPPGTPPEQAKDAFLDRKARAIAILEEANKRDAELSHAYKGGLHMDAGQIDEAIREYRAGSKGSSVDAILSREGLGVALEAKAMAEKDPGARQKTLEEALAAFATMQVKKDGYRYGYALYHQGRVQQTLGKTAEAKALFEQAKTAATGDLGPLVERRLAALGAS